MRINLGATIVCQGGAEAGSVERLVMAPESLEITHLIVSEGGVLNRDVVVPIGSVHEALFDRVYLSLDFWQIKQMPEYSEMDFVAPPANWQAPSTYSSAELVFQAYRVAEAIEGKGKLFVGQEVHCPDGRAGTIRELRVQPISGKVVYIIVTLNGKLPESTVIPLEWVQQIDANRVIIACVLSQLQYLPRGGPAKNSPTTTTSY